MLRNYVVTSRKSITSQILWKNFVCGIIFDFFGDDFFRDLHNFGDIRDMECIKNVAYEITFLKAFTKV